MQPSDDEHVITIPISGVYRITYGQRSSSPPGVTMQEQHERIKRVVEAASMTTDEMQAIIDRAMRLGQEPSGGR